MDIPHKALCVLLNGRAARGRLGLLLLTLTLCFGARPEGSESSALHSFMWWHTGCDHTLVAARTAKASIGLFSVRLGEGPWRWRFGSQCSAIARHRECFRLQQNEKRREMICARTKKTTSCSKQAGVVAGASQTTRKKMCGAKGETDADVAIGKSCK